MSSEARAGRGQWWIVAGVCSLVLILVGVGWTERDRFIPIGVGASAPEYAARNLNGDAVAVSDLRGRVVLLNIWATWCAPCRHEMPSMQRLHEELGPEGLEVVAVSVDARPGRRDIGGRPGGNVASFVREMALDFPIWLDPEGDIQRTYRTTGVPESFVIDRNGTIVRRVIGAIEWDHEANLDLFRRLLAD